MEIMCYEKFKGLVEKQFIKYLPSEYRNMEVVVVKARKVNNQVLDGLIIRRKYEQNDIYPTIYINDMYEDYKQIHNYDEVLQKWADNALRNFSAVWGITPKNIIKANKGQIVLELVNTKLNKELLADVPNRSFLDLSIIYRLILKRDKEDNLSSIITNEIAKCNGWNEEDLFKFATANTRKIYPTVIKSFADLCNEFGEMDTEMFDIRYGDSNMWILSNDCVLRGAINMLFDEPLHSLSDRLQSNLYILPSSIHEVILVSADLGILDAWTQIVKIVNDEEVPPEEILSDQVYYYDRAKRTISFATDISNTRCACLA